MLCLRYNLLIERGIGMFFFVDLLVNFNNLLQKRLIMNYNVGKKLSRVFRKVFSIQFLEIIYIVILQLVLKYLVYMKCSVGCRKYIRKRFILLLAFRRICYDIGRLDVFLFLSQNQIIVGFIYYVFQELCRRGSNKRESFQIYQ